jgi:cephalosporin hydroxylase
VCDEIDHGHVITVDTQKFEGRPEHPRHRTHVPLPWAGTVEAATEFLAFNSHYEVDRACEKFLHTANPRGFLRRTVEDAP